MWSVLADLHPMKKDPQRVLKYVDFAEELDFKNISFPVKTFAIQTFEAQNKISVTVSGYEKGSLFPVHITEVMFDLLMISDGQKSHCLIKNMNRLLGHQKRYGHRYHYCTYCLQGFTNQCVLEKRQSYCKNHGAQKVELPKEEDKLLFLKTSKNN